MQTILKFSKNEVKKLVDHSLNSPIFNPLFVHTLDKKYWKEGAVPNGHGFVNAKDVDVSKIEPYICLVKDSGCYLMCGTRENLPGKDTKKFVVYAAGFGPDADWDIVQDACGGDDFCEGLPLEWFVEALSFPGEFVMLKFTGDNIVLLEPAE